MARTRNALQAAPGHTGRWLAGAISVGAGAATILASAHSCGMIGDASVSRRTIAAMGVDWVGLTPAADTAHAVGDTLRYVATVTDKHGAALVGAWLQWSSSDTAVAHVDSTGIVVARRRGTATIRAAAGERVAEARVLVAPRLAHIGVADTAIRVTETSSRILAARGLDARGYPIVGARIRWRTSDSSVAMVDTAGTVRGVGAGSAVISAQVDTFHATIGVVVEPVPHQLIVVSGDSQSAPAGAPLTGNVTIRVESRRGRPLPGVPVRFTLRDGGSLQVSNPSSDSAGIVRASWTLGSTPGAQALHATVDGLEPGVVLVADAEPDARNVRVTSFVGDTVEAGASSAVAVSIRATDSLGRLLVGLPVTWTAGDSGSIVARGPRTDSLGESHALWSPGPRSGRQHATARIGSGRRVPPVTLTLNTRAGAPANLVGTTGHGQKGSAGSMLPQPLTLRVVDRFRNGVPGVRVTATVSAGRLVDSAATTDSTGTVRFRWVLGRKMGQQQAVVRAGRLAPVTATVQATAAQPASIEFLSSPSSGRVGKSLGRLKLVIVDAWGNRVNDRQVVFTASAGSVTPSRVMPGADGVVVTQWKLGSKAGRQVLSATVRGTAIRTVLEVKAVR